MEITKAVTFHELYHCLLAEEEWWFLTVRFPESQVTCPGKQSR